MRPATTTRWPSYEFGSDKRSLIVANTGSSLGGVWAADSGRCSRNKSRTKVINNPRRCFSKERTFDIIPLPKFSLAIRYREIWMTVLWVTAVLVGFIMQGTPVRADSATKIGPA